MNLNPSPHLSAAAQAEAEIHDLCGECYAKPLEFVLRAYRWPINGEPGPDVWQREALLELGAQVLARGFDGGESVAPIRMAFSTGNGCGKTALFAWIVDWLMSTREKCRGTVTANTNDQLDKKTWAAVREWTKRCITAHWFEINSSVMYRKGAPREWFCAPISCAPENADAYQGQHAKGSTSWYLFDEASGIPKTIWEAAEGGLTDEPIFLVGGNPLRNSGEFYHACFGEGRNRWHPRIVDARACRVSNKALIAEWLEKYQDEDSDFFRVRVRGLAPRASELQYIDQERVWAAQKRHAVTVLPDEPLIAGVDVSGGGAAWNVVRFRRGADARSIPPIRMSGEKSRDSYDPWTNVLAGILREPIAGQKVAMMFVDRAFGSPYVQRLQALGFANVMEVNFGAPSPDPHQANMRAYMWHASKEWLPTGIIPAGDQRLATDACGAGYHINKQNQLVIEDKESMKKRGVDSPDDWDAHVLTFAQPVQPQRDDHRIGPRPGGSWQTILIFALSQACAYVV